MSKQCGTHYIQRSLDDNVFEARIAVPLPVLLGQQRVVRSDLSNLLLQGRDKFLHFGGIRGEDQCFSVLYHYFDVFYTKQNRIFPGGQR